MQQPTLFSTLQPIPATAVQSPNRGAKPVDIAPAETATFLPATAESTVGLQLRFRPAIRVLPAFLVLRSALLPAPNPAIQPAHSSSSQIAAAPHGQSKV